MPTSTFDADDQEAGFTVGGGALILLALCLAFHFGGFRASSTVAGNVTL